MYSVRFITSTTIRVQNLVVTRCAVTFLGSSGDVRLDGPQSCQNPDSDGCEFTYYACIVNESAGIKWLAAASREVVLGPSIHLLL